MDNDDYYNYSGSYTEWRKISEGDEMYQQFVDWKPQVSKAAGLGFVTF
mgnify:CR=1 FL=1